MVREYRIAARSTYQADIILYDAIGRGAGGVDAARVIQDLKARGSVKELTIRINSPGGIAFDGVAIYNNLVAHPARKIVYVDGEASSAASIIAMAGDEINMARGSLMLIHRAYADAIGDASLLRSLADRLDVITDRMAEIYALRTGREVSETLRWMENDNGYGTVFDDRAALAAGLATAIVDAERIAALSAPWRRAKPGHDDADASQFPLRNALLRDIERMSGRIDMATMRRAVTKPAS